MRRNYRLAAKAEIFDPESHVRVLRRNLSHKRAGTVSVRVYAGLLEIEWSDYSGEYAQADRGQKNAGLKAVTLIATLNPVSQVLW